MDESERGAAPCQAKVHIRAGEALSVFNLLCERGITKWVPSTTAFSDSHGTYLNGLFGVIKPGRFTAASETGSSCNHEFHTSKWYTFQS